MTRVAAVTGANKGIGLAIVRQLALQYPKSTFNDGPLLIYLTARNEERGKAALESLNTDKTLQKAKALKADGGLTDVEYLPLDVDSEDSIKAFASTLKESHPDGIDFLINNAAIAMEGFDLEIVKKTLHCNYYGTLSATRLLLPHIKDGGRIVNVSSAGGRLGPRYSSTIKSRFLNATSPDEISQLMEDFTTAVQKNTLKGEWPGAAYAVSKAGVIGVTKCLALENAKSGSKVLINSCCPGWVRTDMTKGGGSKSPDEGARTPVLLALGEIRGANGEFWKDERVTNWES
jgi:carbonyl reductase 1